jgi:hypothetical protein
MDHLLSREHSVKTDRPSQAVGPIGRLRYFGSGVPEAKSIALGPGYEEWQVKLALVRPQ